MERLPRLWDGLSFPGNFKAKIGHVSTRSALVQKGIHSRTFSGTQEGSLETTTRVPQRGASISLCCGIEERAECTQAGALSGGPRSCTIIIAGEILAHGLEWGQDSTQGPCKGGGGSLIEWVTEMQAGRPDPSGEPSAPGERESHSPGSSRAHTAYPAGISARRCRGQSQPGGRARTLQGRERKRH